MIIKPTVKISSDKRFCKERQFVHLDEEYNETVCNLFRVRLSENLENEDNIKKCKTCLKYN